MTWTRTEVVSSSTSPTYDSGGGDTPARGFATSLSSLGTDPGTDPGSDSLKTGTAACRFSRSLTPLRCEHVAPVGIGNDPIGILLEQKPLAHETLRRLPNAANVRLMRTVPLL